MRRAPILELDYLPDSTYYYWIGRISKLYQLCIWAAWWKASREGVSVTLEAIFGECGFAGYIFKDTRTDEMCVAFELPGDHYEFYGQMYNAKKPTSEIRSGSRLFDGVTLTGEAVDKVLKDHLGDATLRELLRYLPFFGKFKGEALPFNEQAVGQDRKDQMSKVMGESGRSLRDSYKPRHKFLVVDDDVHRAELAKVLNHKAVRAAILALEDRSPIVSDRNRTQRKLALDDPKAS